MFCMSFLCGFSIWCFMAICAFFVSSYNRTSLSLLNPFSYSVFTHSWIQRLSKNFATSNTWMPLASSLPFFTEFKMALITNRLSRIPRPFLPPSLLSVRFLSTKQQWCAPFEQKMWLKCAPLNFWDCSQIKKRSTRLPTRTPKELQEEDQLWPCCSSSLTNCNALRFWENILTMLWLGINLSLSPWFMHFCREFSFVVTTRFLGGTFGLNLVMVGNKTF